jgi:uncharacterized protein YfiM (DUF2279 family)
MQTQWWDNRKGVNQSESKNSIVEETEFNYERKYIFNFFLHSFHLNLLKKSLFFLFLYSISQNSYSQIDRTAADFCATKPSQTLDKKKLRGLIIGESLVYSSAMFGLYFLWYKDEINGGFHSFNDWPEWQQMDKLGHFTTAFILSELSYKGYSWTGIEANKANKIAFLQSMLFMTSLEVLDGFSQGWGFSWSDMGFNLAGASLNYYRNSGYKKLQITPKFSFGKSDISQWRPDLLGNNFPSRMMKDYNAQTYWLSINYNGRTKAGESWVNGICLSIGYGAQGMTGGTENVFINEQGISVPEFQRFRQWYISLDYDWTKLPAYKNGNRFFKGLCNGLNIFKFPLPALEFSRGKVFMNWTSYGR